MTKESEKRGMEILRALPSEAAACASLRGGLTDEEVALLLRKRALSEELRGLRRERGSRPEDDARAREIRSELEVLDGLIADARGRRMVLLGHQEP